MSPVVARPGPLSVEPRLLSRLRAAERVCVLTGAGVSAESGIPTFRGPDGTWSSHDVRRLATPEGFRADPVLVWEWYRSRQRAIMKASPNPAHAALADMEPSFREFTLATQNVDGMHRRAGSRDPVELHGSLWRMRCTACDAVVDLQRPVAEVPPVCSCGAVMRPDVVWFGEPLPAWPVERAARAAAECEVMFVIGTSAVVYPASSLPLLTKDSGGTVVEVNTGPTPVTAYADTSFLGPAGVIVPEIWHSLLKPERFMK